MTHEMLPVILGGVNLVIIFGIIWSIWKFDHKGAQDVRN